MTAVKRPNKRRSSIPLAMTGTPSVIAAGSICALLASPALAIELGELQVESSLGQPLRASIAYALAPNEQINNKCVYLRAATPGAGLPTITRATTTLSGSRIVLRGSTPLREPMMNLQVAVDCAYTARLQRDYLVLLDPPSATEQRTAPAPVTAAAPEPAVRSVAANRTTRRNTQTQQRSTAPATPVTGGSQYQVRPGDTLSEIVSRIEDRRIALWPAVSAIYAANPNAFLDGNVDRLIAGSTLVIPTSVTDAGQRVASVPVTVNSAPATAPASAQPATSSRAYRGIAEGAPEVVNTAPTSGVDSTAMASTAVTEPVVPEVTEPVEESPFVDENTAAPAEGAAVPAPTVTIPDTRIEQQPAPIAVGDSGSDSPAQAWLVWLGGSGVAIVLALLLFGRRLRDAFGRAQTLDDLDETELNPALPMRRASDRGEPDETDSINLRDTMANADPFEVQVNLDDGSGFDSSSDVDVAQDYSFASSGTFSRDGLPVDDNDEITAETDIMSAPVKDAAIEVEEQSVPGEGTGYDMSMIVDVTKQDFGSAATTARDLQAIEVTPLTQDPGQSGTMELTSEFDYEVLQQDYEDELTATQALNREIEKAAMELQDRLGEFDDDPSRISMAEDLEGTAEVTAEMPQRSQAENDTLNKLGLDSTDISEDMTAVLPDSKDDSTVEMGPDADATVQQPRKKTG